jgi:hypothetical protein
MRKLAAGLGFACTVLLLLAFDEGQATRAVDAVRAGVEPVVTRAGSLIRGGTAPVPAPAAGAYPVLYGRYVPRGPGPGGALDFVAAELRFETGGVLRTRPARIAWGRERFAARLHLAPDAQIELREVVPMKGARTVQPTALCQNSIPGWVALAQHDGRVEIALYRAGAAPGATDPGLALCGTWTYVKR